MATPAKHPDRHRVHPERSARKTTWIASAKTCSRFRRPTNPISATYPDCGLSARDRGLGAGGGAHAGDGVELRELGEERAHALMRLLERGIPGVRLAFCRASCGAAVAGARRAIDCRAVELCGAPARDRDAVLRRFAHAHPMDRRG